MFFATALLCSVNSRSCVEKGRSELESRNFASKTADLKARHELRNRNCAARTTDLKERDELRAEICASKMADLNLTPEPLYLVREHPYLSEKRT